MPFGSMMKDNVDLIKAHGTTTSGLKASVQGAKSVFLFPQHGSQLVVETGDLIRRNMSNGVAEVFRVVEPGFHEAFHGIAAHYQMTVQKLDPAAAKIAIASIGEDAISDERRNQLFSYWEEQGVDFIKQDLMSGGVRIVGGPPATRKLAQAWVRMKEEEARQAAQPSPGHTFNVSGPNSRVNFQSTDQSHNTVVNNTLFKEIHEAIDNGVQDAAERDNLKARLTALEAAKDRQSFVTQYQAFITAAANHVTILTPFLPALTGLLTQFSS
jgi:hypothetical protein